MKRKVRIAAFMWRTNNHTVGLEEKVKKMLEEVLLTEVKWETSYYLSSDIVVKWIDRPFDGVELAQTEFSFEISKYIMAGVNTEEIKELIMNSDIAEHIQYFYPF